MQVNNQGYPYIWPSHYCKDSQITSLKLFLIVIHSVNFKHNFPKETDPLSSELPYHIYDWLIISLNEFCIVIRKWQIFAS